MTFITLFVSGETEEIAREAASSVGVVVSISRWNFAWRVLVRVNVDSASTAIELANSSR